MTTYNGVGIPTFTPQALAKALGRDHRCPLCDTDWRLAGCVHQGLTFTVLSPDVTAGKLIQWKAILRERAFEARLGEHE